jgi:hypothetical protein
VQIVGVHLLQDLLKGPREGVQGPGVDGSFSSTALVTTSVGRLFKGGSRMLMFDEAGILPLNQLAAVRLDVGRRPLLLSEGCALRRGWSCEANDRFLNACWERCERAAICG